jgi:ribosomal protein S18 acetylase RimI-like enzyme
MLITHTIQSNDEGRINVFLIRNSDYFSPPLSSRINIVEYAKKLADKAINIILTRGGIDLGHAAIYLNNPPKAFLSSFCIDHDHQRKHLGGVLMEEVVKTCSYSQIAFIELEVSITNAKARSFYLKHGFEPYAENHEIVYMRKQLAACRT